MESVTSSPRVFEVFNFVTDEEVAELAAAAGEWPTSGFLCRGRGRCADSKPPCRGTVRMGRQRLRHVRADGHAIKDLRQDPKADDAGGATAFRIPLAARPDCWAAAASVSPLP